MPSQVEKGPDLVAGKEIVYIPKARSMLNHLRCMYNRCNKTIFHNWYSNNYHNMYMLLYEYHLQQDKFLKKSLEVSK